jgi:two-component system NtrC family sensor kinase
MTGTVLVVDDSLTVRMDLLEILEAAGLRAQACDTVVAARQALAQDRFTLVILDVLLPDGDGIELLKEIRAMPSAAGTAVMLLSTETEIRNRIHGLTTGADDYVGKPYDPVYLVARARELVRGAGGGAASSRQTILLIDDSLTFREALKEVLDGAGYRVLVASNGENGLRLAADQHPAAIIVDGTLPGIDGATVIRRVRLDAALRRLPCLLLTGSEDHGAEIRALDAGADAFVRKEADAAFILARLNAMLRSAGTQSTGPPSLLGPKKILAVDDSETYLQELAGALRADGYELVLARSGEEALNLLAVQQVDCVLLDLMMPGIGGLETCRRVKSVPVTRDIPVVMLTALEDHAAMIEGLSAGADDYVAKSTEFDLLRARVLAQLRRKQFADENRMMREQLLLTEFEAAEGRAARKLAQTQAAQLAAENAERRRVEGETYALINAASHDLKAPLHAIMHLEQWIGEDIGPAASPETTEYLRLLRGRVARLQMLLDGLLAYLHVGSGHISIEEEEVDIAELVRDIAVTLVPSPGFVITCDGNMPVFRTHRASVHGVLENLIGNALKHHDRAEGRIAVSARLDAGVTEIRVSDDGPGISPQFHDRIFVIFQTLATRDEKESSGIGLAMVKKQVEGHGGRVWVESMPPARGTTFAFTWNESTS